MNALNRARSSRGMSRFWVVRIVPLLATCIVASQCSRPAAPPDTPASGSPASSPSAAHADGASPSESVAREDEELDRVAVIHGAPGPWAVAGFRMGRFALVKLDLPSGSFDLEITHHTPREVRYSCIADGAAAATGASMGKLNLNLVESDVAGVATSYRRKSTGRVVTLRPAASFRARFADTPREKARELGRTVLRLPDAEIFEEVTGRVTE